MYRTIFILLSICVSALAQHPGAPLKSYGPAKMVVGVFYDHNGQDLFKKEQNAASVFNSYGVQLGYSPWAWVKLGLSLAGTEFDHNKPARVSDGYAFNAGFGFGTGALLSLHSPKLFKTPVAVYGYAAGDMTNAADDYGNEREVLLIRSGIGVLWQHKDMLSLSVGADWHYVDGTQKNNSGQAVFGSRNPIRGAVVLELYPKTNKDLMSSRPFFNVGFRFSENIGSDEHLGLENASLSVSVGLITDFLYGKYKEGADEDYE